MYFYQNCFCCLGWYSNHLSTWKTCLIYLASHRRYVVLFLFSQQPCTCPILVAFPVAFRFSLLHAHLYACYAQVQISPGRSIGTWALHYIANCYIILALAVSWSCWYCIASILTTNSLNNLPDTSVVLAAWPSLCLFFRVISLVQMQMYSSHLFYRLLMIQMLLNYKCTMVWSSLRMFASIMNQRRFQN